RYANSPACGRNTYWGGAPSLQKRTRARGPMWFWNALSCSFGFVDDQQSRSVADLRRFAGPGVQQDISGIPMQHKAVVGMAAVGPEADRPGEVPDIDDSLGRTISEIERKEVGIRTVV